MFRPDDPVPSADAYEAYWSSTEVDFDVPILIVLDPESDPSDSYAAFHAAADE
jgi:hypothetical protein